MAAWHRGRKRRDPYMGGEAVTAQGTPRRCQDASNACGLRWQAVRRPHLSLRPLQVGPLLWHVRSCKPVRAQTSLTSPRRKKPKSRRRAKRQNGRMGGMMMGVAKLHKPCATELRMILIRSWQSWTRPKRARKQARRRRALAARYICGLG